MPQESLAPPQAPGFSPPDVKGNVQWYNRPEADTSSIKQGTTGTVYSTSREEDGYEVLFPQIYDGKLHPEDEAWQHYKQTGQHMGKWKVDPKNPDAAYKAADAYGGKYHEDAQAGKYGTFRGKMQTQGTSTPLPITDVNNPEPNDSLSGSLMQPTSPTPLPTPGANVTGPTPPQPTQAPVQHALGHTLGKVFSSLSGGHTEYTIDPQTGTTVPTQVKDPPGQTFRSILALGLMGGQGIGPQHGQMTFAQGLLSGLGGGVREATERNDMLDKQRRQQSQEQYANQLKADQETREKKKLTMEEQLNQVAIADHNQNMVARKQIMDKQAYDTAKEKAIDVALPLQQHSQMLTEADAPKVSGYKSLNIDPLAAGLTQDEAAKYLSDHPGASTKELGLHTGTRTSYDPVTGQMKVEDLYSIYPSMTKVPPSMLQQMKSDGADNPKSTLHSAYMSLTSNKDGNMDIRKLLPIYRDMNDWENLQKSSLDRQVKQSEIARNFASLDRDKLELQLEKLKLTQEQDKVQAIDLYNKSFDPSTNHFRPEVLTSLEPKLDANGKPATKEDVEKMKQRDLLLAAINSQNEAKTAELYDKYKPRKDASGALVFDDPAATLQLDYLKNLHNAAAQLLRPEQFAKEQAVYNALSPVGKKIVDQIKNAGQQIDPAQLQTGLNSSKVSPQDQMAIFNALGVKPPAPIVAQPTENRSPYGAAVEDLTPGILKGALQGVIK